MIRIRDAYPKNRQNLPPKCTIKALYLLTIDIEILDWCPVLPHGENMAL